MRWKGPCLVERVERLAGCLGMVGASCSVGDVWSRARSAKERERRELLAAVLRPGRGMAGGDVEA